jgi:hypothetical protein
MEFQMMHGKNNWITDERQAPTTGLEGLTCSHFLKTTEVTVAFISQQ